MKTLTVLAFAFIALLTARGADRPEFFDSFDPAKGFKPAQDNLTQVFLQIAGSLEHHGSPEPYLRHMAKEHQRIEALYLRTYGKAPKSYRPSFMTDEYLNRLCANWNLLSPKLGLEAFAKEMGHGVRNAIKGTRGTGTIIVEILNSHQSKVFDSRAGAGNGLADFETLKSQLISRLELDKPRVDEERYEIARRDAVSFALGIQGDSIKLFKRLDAGLKTADAERVKTVLMSIIMDVGQMAQSELEVGISEWAIRRASTVAK